MGLITRASQTGASGGPLAVVTVARCLIANVRTITYDSRKVRADREWAVKERGFDLVAPRRPTFSIRKMMLIVVWIGCFLGRGHVAEPGGLERERGSAAINLRRACFPACASHFRIIIRLTVHFRRPLSPTPTASRCIAGVLILPFLEEQPLYAQYDFSEPWDGPRNIKLLNRMPAIFDCPSRPGSESVPSTLTSYVVVSGPGTLFPGAKPVDLDPAASRVASTLMIVEASNARIPWTKPEDLNVPSMSLRINDTSRAGISSPHPGGAQRDVPQQALPIPGQLDLARRTQIVVDHPRRGARSGRLNQRAWKCLVG